MEKIHLGKPHFGKNTLGKIVIWKLVLVIAFRKYITSRGLRLLCNFPVTAEIRKCRTVGARDANASEKRDWKLEQQQQQEHRWQLAEEIFPIIVLLLLLQPRDWKCTILDSAKEIYSNRIKLLENSIRNRCIYEKHFVRKHSIFFKSNGVTYLDDICLAVG